MADIPSEIVEFITKWAVATGQNPGDATQRFWELMINKDISDEMKDQTITKWAGEAGYDFRK